MEKHNVIEESRTPGLEKEAAGGDMFDEAKLFFIAGSEQVVDGPRGPKPWKDWSDAVQGPAPHVSEEK